MIVLLAATLLGAGPAGAQVIAVGPPSDLAVLPSDTAVIPVEIDMSGAPGLSLGSIQFEFYWDPGLLNYLSAATNAPSGWTIVLNESQTAAGVLVVAMFSATGTFTSFTALTLTFQTAAAPSPTNTPLDIVPTAAGDPLGNSILALTVDRDIPLCVGTAGIMGDVTGELIVNIIDAQQIARYVVGLAPPPDSSLVQRFGDVNRDQLINIIDAQQVARAVIGLPASGVGDRVPGGCASATQMSFKFTPGDPSLTPTVSAAGFPTCPAVQIYFRDDRFDLAPYSGEVSLELNGSPSATLTGATTAIPEGGMAWFPGIVVDRIGYYALTATSTAGDLPPVQSTPFEVTVPGDLNADAAVDSLDLQILQTHFNENVYCAPWDINRDFVVDVRDMGILLSNWGNRTVLATSGQASPTGDVGPSDLYVVEADSMGEDILVGRVQTASGTQPVITDLAISPAGELYGISYTTLYLLSRVDASATAIGNLGVADANALAFDTAGILFAATASGTLLQVDSQTGATTPIGQYGSGYESWGDIAFAPDGTLYGTVRTTAGASLLVTINPQTGLATPVKSSADLGVGVWGLSFVGNALIGLSADQGAAFGTVVELDTALGTATYIRNLTFDAFGAGAPPAMNND